MTHNLDTTSLLSRNREVLSTKVDDELMMMDVEQGMCFALDKVGCEIWLLLAQPMRLADLVADLTERFDVASEICEADTLEFVRSMVDEGLIRVDVA